MKSVKNRETVTLMGKFIPARITIGLRVGLTSDTVLYVMHLFKKYKAGKWKTVSFKMRRKSNIRWIRLNMAELLSNFSSFVSQGFLSFCSRISTPYSRNIKQW